MQRAVCVFLVLILAATLTVTLATAAELSYVKGDADGDGQISSIDVTTIYRVVTETIPDEDGMIARRGDVTGGGLTILDVTAIQRYLASFDDSYHIGKTVFYDPTDDNQLPIMK